MLLGPAGNSFPMPEFRSNGWICIPNSIYGASLLCTANDTIYITIYTIPWRLPGENTLRAAASVDPPVCWLTDDWLAERLSRKDDNQNAAAPDVPFCSLSSHVKLLAACLLYIPTSQLHLGALAPHQTLFFTPNARWKSSLSSSSVRPCAAGAAVRTPPDTWRKTQPASRIFIIHWGSQHIFFFYSPFLPFLLIYFLPLVSSPLSDSRILCLAGSAKGRFSDRQSDDGSNHERWSMSHVPMFEDLVAMDPLQSSGNAVQQVVWAGWLWLYVSTATV